MMPNNNKIYFESQSTDNRFIPATIEHADFERPRSSLTGGHLPEPGTENTTIAVGSMPRSGVLAVGTRNVHPHGPNVYYESNPQGNRKRLAATSTGILAGGVKHIPRTTV